MAERTALEILMAIEDEIGLERSVSVAATDINTRQLMAFLNATLEETMLLGDWSSAEKEAVIQFLGPTTISATITENSAVVTVADSSPFAPPYAWMVIGENIQTNTRLIATPNGTTLTMDKWANASGVVDLVLVQDTYALPDDFAFWIPQTQWDSRFQWQLIGPTSSQFDAWQRNGIVGPYPRRQFRKQGPAPTAFRIFPPPTASGDWPGTLTYRYITTYGATSVAGVGKRFFTADGDTPLMSDRLLILGTKWRWQQAKGFDFGPLQEEYYNWFDSSMVTDKGESVLPIDGTWGDENWLDRFHVQDGNFPG